MRQCNYPLDVMHNYRIQTSEAAAFAELALRIRQRGDHRHRRVSTARRPLSPMVHRARRDHSPSQTREIVISRAGVREGCSIERLSAARARRSASLRAREQGALLRGPRLRRRIDRLDRRLHGSSELDETFEDKRLATRPVCFRRFWRAHPDYRARQATNIVTHGPLSASIIRPGLSRAGRGVPHQGAKANIDFRAARVFTTRLLIRRGVGSAMRVAYLLSASMPGVFADAAARAYGRLTLTCGASAICQRSPMTAQDAGAAAWLERRSRPSRKPSAPRVLTVPRRFGEDWRAAIALTGTSWTNAHFVTGTPVHLFHLARRFFLLEAAIKSMATTA